MWQVVKGDAVLGDCLVPEPELTAQETAEVSKIMDLFYLFDDDGAEEASAGETGSAVPATAGVISSEPAHVLEVKKEMIETVKHRCSQLSLPLLQEYDFTLDPTPNLILDLKPYTKLRPYQTVFLLF